MNDPKQLLQPPRTGMRLFDAEGRRLYLTEEERRAFLAAAARAAPSRCGTPGPCGGCSPRRSGAGPGEP